MYYLTKIFLASAVSVFLLSFSSGIQQTDKWVADPFSKNLKNPVKNSEASIKAGKTIYSIRCAVCHGESGTGDGPGAQALTPKPANHTSASVQVQTDGEIFWKISEGRGAMIGWKAILSEQERWQLVNYIRSLAAD